MSLINKITIPHQLQHLTWMAQFYGNGVTRRLGRNITLMMLHARSMIWITMVYRKGDSPGDFRLIITFCSDNAVAMIDGNGNTIWHIRGYHFESIDIGDVCPGYPGNEIFVDIDHCPWGESPAWLLSGEGKILGIIITDRSRRHTLVDWDGNGLKSMVIGQAQARFGYDGKKNTHFEIPGINFPSNNMIRCFDGFMTGDGIMDILFLTEIDNEYKLFIYKNPSTSGSGEFESGTGYNFTYY